MKNENQPPPKKEIVSLNPELYEDLSIEQLEERLEMVCIINYGCSVDCNCNADVDVPICGCDVFSCTCNLDTTICAVDGCTYL